MIIGPQSAAWSMNLWTEDRPNEGTTSPTATAGLEITDRGLAVGCPVRTRRAVYRPVANCTSTGPNGADVEVLFLVDGM